MERPAKRQRLFTPPKYAVNHSFHEVYRQPRREEDEMEQDSDPELDLQQQRARCDYKLKSRFESIFEKYGKDFSGIADEIDVETGEIVVNNGHLMGAHDEYDAGVSSDGGMLESASQETEEITDTEMDDEIPYGYGDEAEDEDQEEEDDEEEDDDPLSEGDMLEDDMILRGLTQRKQILQSQRSPELVFSSQGYAASFQEPRRAAHRPSLGGSNIPSRAEIMAQFGPQFGPDIVKYIKRQGALEDESIEPAWRAPDIAPIAAQRPKARAIAPLPEVERSPSPETTSIWAAPVGQGRKTRVRFTNDENEILLAFVARARRKGHNLSLQGTWEQLEEAYPRHTWNAWKLRYKRVYEESEQSNSEDLTSYHLPVLPNARSRVPINRVDPPSHREPVAVAQRPGGRVRKPVQRDPNVLSWSEAVHKLQTDDPFQHAELLRDARQANGGTSFHFDQPTPASSSRPESHMSQKNSFSKHSLHQYPDISRPLSQPKQNHAQLQSGTEDELAGNDLTPEHQLGTPERVPCPHADCRKYSSAKYRRKLFENEKFSPLSEHLMHVHHTTPYPCAEPQCIRQGEDGYYFENELVMHVKEAHPYAAALQALRGRVDPALLKQKVNPKRSRPSVAPRPCTPDDLPRDSEFFSPQRRRVSSSSQQLSSPGQGKILSSRALNIPKPTSAVPSSLRVHPSSATARDVQDQEHSEVQNVGSGPFLNQETPTKRKIHPCPYKNSFTSCEEKFASVSEAKEHAQVHISRHNQCPFSGCHELNNEVHQSWHEEQELITRRRQYAQEVSKPSTLEHTGLSNSGHLIPSTIPNSQSSADAFVSSAPMTVGESAQRAKPSIVKPSLPLDKLDASYAFSDEEDIAPLPTKTLPKPPPKKLASEIPESIESSPAQVPLPMKSAPIKGHLPPDGVAVLAPAAVAKQKISVPANDLLPSIEQPTPPVTKKAPRQVKKIPIQQLSDENASMLKPTLITPAAKPKPQKSILRGVLDPGDFDELSFGTEEFVLISSRPRTGPPISETTIRIKQEVGVNGSPSIPTRKRKLDTSQGDDEIDELGTNEPTFGIQPRIKSEPNSSAEKTRSLAKTTKTRRKRNSGNKVTAIVSPPNEPILPRQKPLLTPSQQPRNTSVSTPLIDLVTQDSSSDAVIRAALNLPLSTSDVGSSPTARTARERNREAGSPILGLPTPIRLKHWSAKTIKREDDNGLVSTPGGTVRRCGEMGFKCGRLFCFICGSGVIAS